MGCIIFKNFQERIRDMNKKKLIITVSALLLVLILGVTVFFQFFYIPYNAVIYSHAEDMLLEEFLDENKIGGAFYENPDYVEGVDDPRNEIVRYDELPTTRTYIIKDSETYEKIFKADEIEVDFDKEIILLYVFGDYEFYLDYYIKDISVVGKQVSVYVQKERSDKKGGAMPAPRCIAVKMDKLDVDEVEFVAKR